MSGALDRTERWRRAGTDRDTPDLTADTRQADQRRRNVPKDRAHLAVQRGLTRGAITRQPCEVCGHPGTDAHHDDDADPLRVRWLCRQHHTRLHKGGEDLFAERSEKVGGAKRTLSRR